MQFAVTIDMVHKLEWGLNEVEAFVFAYLHSHSEWCESLHIDGREYRWVSRSKLLQELPSVATSIRTVARALASLVDKGVIERVLVDGKTYTSITPKGARWMKAPEGWGVSAGPRAKSGTGGVPKVAQGGVPKVAHNQLNHLSVKPLEQKDVPSRDGTTPQAVQPTLPLEHPSPPSSNTRGAYPTWFERLWKVYPRRSGGNSKKAAFKAVSARLRQGVSVEQLTDGLSRYSAYVASEGMEGTPYVMQASTFFGPNENWNQSWKPSSSRHKPKHARLHKSISEMASKDYHAETGLSIEAAFAAAAPSNTGGPDEDLG